MFTVTTSYLGNKWQWTVRNTPELFRLLDKLQRVFAPAEIKVASAAPCNRAGAIT